MRRALRWTVRGVLALLALAVVAVIAIVIALHTAWGRERVRRRLEAALDAKVHGDVRIGAVEGSPLGELVLVDVVVTNEAGDEVARIDRASLNVGLTSLLSNEVELEYLRVDGAVVRGTQAPDGSVDLARLLLLDDEPLSWDVTIDELTLRRVQLVIDRRGVVDHLDELELHGAVAVRDGAARVTASTRLTAWWREQALPVIAAGGVHLDGETIAVSGVHADVGGIAVVAPYLELVGGRITGAVSAFVPAATVARLMPDSPLRGDVAITFGVTPGVAPRTVAVQLHGLVGGAPIVGVGTGDLDAWRLRAHLLATGLDVEQVVAVELPEGARGPRDVVLDGEVDLAHARGELFAVIAGPRGETATANLAFQLDEERQLAVRGRVRGHALAVADARARDLTIDLDIAGLPSAPRGTIHADGRGVRRGADVFGPVRLDATTRDDGRIDVVLAMGDARTDVRLAGAATVSLGDTIEIALGRYAGVVRGTRLAGEGGVIAIAPTRATVKGLRLAVARGRIAVDGWYGRRSGDLDADVVARGVDLGAVDRTLRGKADVTAHVARHDLAWSGEVHARGRGLVVRRGGAPVDGFVDASAHGKTVTVAANVHGARLGAVAVAFEVTPPRNAFDVGAWQRLPRGAIRAGRVTLDALDLSALAAVIGATQARGRVDGELAITPSSSTGALRVRGLQVPGGPGAIDADLALARTQPGVLDATLDASVQDLGAVHATASISIPTRPFDLAGWRALDASDVRGIEARADDILIDGELARRLGLGAPWQGHVSLAVAVSAGLRDATITADLLGVRGGPLLRRVDLHVDGRADRDGLTARIQVGAGGTWLLDAQGTLAVSPAKVFEQGVAALRAAPLEATITVDKAPVRRLLRELGRDQAIAGTVSVDAKITGTLGAPTGDATITLAGVGSMRSLQIDARYAAGAVDVKARGRQDDGGVLRLDASAPVARLDDLRARVVAQGFDLAPLAALGPTETLGVVGTLDADLALRGFDPATAKVEGTLHLHDARMPLGASVGTLRRGDVTAKLAGGRVEVKLTGRVGAGEVEATADARLAGLLPQRADVTVDVHGITLLAPRRPKVSGHVTAKIARQGDQWHVDAEVRDARVALSSDPGRVLHEVGVPDDVVFVDDGRPPPAVAAARVHQRRFGMRPAHPWLVGEIKLRRTTIKSDEMRGQIRGKITIEVGDEGVALLGSVDAPQGDILLFDRRYRIDHAEVLFDGSDDPRIDARLIHAFPQLTLAVTLRGRLSDPKLELASDPADYTQGQLLGFLLGAAPGGRPGDETRDAATMIASSLASAKIGSVVRRFLPVKVDVLRFEAATATDKASITVGHWLARRLYVGYRRRIDAVPEQNAGQAEVEYWLSPRIVVEGVAGDRGYHDLDLTWVRRW